MNKLIYDSNLWFKVIDCEGLHYFIGNPHTFYGRMWAWCPNTQKSFFVSKSGIYESSIESTYWIKGFLTGNEPKPPVDKDGQTAFGKKKYKEWEKAVELFQDTGFWNERKRNCLKCKKKLLKSQIDEICVNCKNE